MTNESHLHLNIVERRIISSCEESSKDIQILAEELGEPNISILRNAHNLFEEGYLTKKTQVETTRSLTERGQQASEHGLPEQRVAKALEASAKTLEELRERFNPQEVNKSIGILKKDGAAEMTRLNGNPALKLIENPYDDYPLDKALRNLSEAQQDTIKELVNRGLVRVEEKERDEYRATEKGREAVRTLQEINLHEHLTPEDLETGAWKDKTYRHYRVNEEPRPKRRGKKHFVKQAIDEVKNIWTSIGFEEMQGNHVQSAFWDLDALFVPQDHPAREMQDTFYVPGKQSPPKNVLQRVKKMHETGDEDSAGWNKAFSEKESEKLLLRTHTTVLSAKKFADLTKEDLPKKYFSVDKVFRNETLDWKHLMEFHQVEGIVVTEKGSLSMLKGYLKEFFGKMGYADIRMRPAYFPYTEPSVEFDVYNENKEEWVEMGGAGIIRPEVTKPLLGFECPVLAWGMGLERILTRYYDVEDLRKLYDNDIERLQGARHYANN